MSEDQEKDQLGLWEKLSRLYGEKAAEGLDSGPDDMPDAAGMEMSAPSLERLVPDLDEAPDSPENPVFQGPVFRLTGGPTENEGQAGRPGQPQSATAHGRVHETCARCRRSCKQNGRKLNRMLCIGFLPIED